MATTPLAAKAAVDTPVTTPWEQYVMSGIDFPALLEELLRTHLGAFPGQRILSRGHCLPAVAAALKKLGATGQIINSSPADGVSNGWKDGINDVVSVGLGETLKDDDFLRHLDQLRTVLKPDGRLFYLIVHPVCWVDLIPKSSNPGKTTAVEIPVGMGTLKAHHRQKSIYLRHIMGSFSNTGYHDIRFPGAADTDSPRWALFTSNAVKK